MNEELALASSTMKQYHAVKGFKALTVQGNITFFVNPLVHNEGYDRPRYAQAYVLDGDIPAATMANLRAAREALGNQQHVSSVFRTSRSWQDFIDTCREGITSLRAALVRPHSFCREFRCVI